MRKEAAPVPAPRPAGRRLLGLLGLALLTVCAGYPALVLRTLSWPEVVALRHGYFDWSPRAYTLGELTRLRAGLAGLATGAGLLSLGLLAGRQWGAAARAEWRGLAQELARAGRGLGAGWRALPPRQRLGAGLVLLALTGLRAYYSVVSQPYDDAISFEVFVRAPLLRVSACYPLPNNHILANTLAWVCYQLYPGFWWSMRLPVLLLSTLGSVVWLLGLLRWAPLRVALGAVAAFGVLQISLYHAAAGRGYWLLIDLAAVGFFGALVLARTPTWRGPAPVGYDRAAWLGLGLAGVLGLYTVPTFAYFLVSAYGWLAWQAARRGGGRSWVALAASAGLTLVGAGLLYTPVLLISGSELLLHNPYVGALPAGQFWRQLPAYWWQLEGTLAGQHGFGTVVTLAGLGLFAWLWWRARAGALPAAQARLVQGLGAASFWFSLLPYVLVLGQRVQAPERTLFYKAQFFFLLASIGADWALRARAGGAWGRRLRLGLLSGGGLFALSQVALLAHYQALRQAAWRAPHGAFAWLATQPPGPVLVPAPDQRMLLRFYAHSERVGQPWQLDERPAPGVRYRYQVRRPGEAPPAGGARPPAFANEAMVIYVVR